MSHFKQKHLARGGRGGLAAWIPLALAVVGLVLCGCGQGDRRQGSADVARSSLEASDSGGGTQAPGGSGQRVAWVIMKQRANLQQPRAGGDWKARGNAVHRALTSVAEQSQASIRAYLSRRGVPHKAFWIVNALKVTADEATLRALERRSDVDRIVPDIP